VTPRSPVEVFWRFGGTCCLYFQCLRVSKAIRKKQAASQAKHATSEQLLASLAYSSTLKMEAVCSSETLVNFYQTSWCHNPENSTFHSYRCCSNGPVHLYIITIVHIFCFSFGGWRRCILIHQCGIQSVFKYYVVQNMLGYSSGGSWLSYVVGLVTIFNSWKSKFD
jgi:hypothetical protein